MSGEERRQAVSADLGAQVKSTFTVEPVNMASRAGEAHIAELIIAEQDARTPIASSDDRPMAQYLKG